MNKNDTNVIQGLNNRISNLEKKNAKVKKEMVKRGIEVTNMIRIFLTNEHLLPEGQREEFRKVAVGYAVRNDEGRGCYCEGQIDFRDAIHLKE